MGTAPVFVTTPKTWKGQVSTANTNRDGSTGTYVQIMAAGTNGSRIDAIRIQAPVAVTAGAVRLFISDGTTRSLYREIEVPATSPVVGTTEPFSFDVPLADAIVLPGGGTPWSLHANTNNAEAFNIFARGGDF